MFLLLLFLVKWCLFLLSFRKMNDGINPININENVFFRNNWKHNEYHARLHDNTSWSSHQWEHTSIVYQIVLLLLHSSYMISDMIKIYWNRWETILSILRQIKCLDFIIEKSQINICIIEGKFYCLKVWM